MTRSIEVAPLIGRYVHMSRPINPDNPEEMLGAAVNDLDPQESSVTSEGWLIAVVQNIEAWQFALRRVDGVVSVVTVRADDPDYRVSVFADPATRELLVGPVQITGGPGDSPNT